MSGVEGSKVNILRREVIVVRMEIKELFAHHLICLEF